MASRLLFHNTLHDLLGSNHVYFQPPSSIAMQYPCIVYKLDYVDTMFADNKPYMKSIRYLVEVIDADPDSLIPGKVSELKASDFVRKFTFDNLNHTLYNVYF